ncbi:MAG: hypothetical protein NDI90_04280 [Nitrospira sp. BO4]|nr:hypothetical protein [Nitrospira sp. BO4]
MMMTQLASTKTILVMAVAALLWVCTVVASADDGPFYFDESGKMQQHGYWSPNSRSKSDFETDRRMYNEWTNAETLRKNRELIDEYYSPKPSAPPSSSSDYWISGPDGQSQWCRPIAPRQVICQ